jgi:hypothetical protein
MGRANRLMQLRSVEKRWIFVFSAAVLAATGGCGSEEPSDAALAAQCMRASADNRVRFFSAWLSNAQVEARDDLVTVRTEVPVGISIGGRVKFRYWEYRCRRRSDGMEFLAFESWK